jgi:hypothetical protein
MLGVETCHFVQHLYGYFYGPTYMQDLRLAQLRLVPEGIHYQRHKILRCIVVLIISTAAFAYAPKFHAACIM